MNTEAVKISDAKLDMLRLILKDPKVKTCVLMDGAYAGEILVKENGDIRLGRTKFGWVNKLFDSYQDIDFFTMASKIAVLITGYAKETSGDLVGLFEEIVNKTLIQNNREQIIDLLFQYIVLFDKTSPYASQYINLAGAKIGSTTIDFGGQIVEIPVVLDRYRQQLYL